MCNVEVDTFAIRCRRDDLTINNSNYSSGRETGIICGDRFDTTISRRKLAYSTPRMHCAVWPAVAANLRISINTGTRRYGTLLASGNVSRRSVYPSVQYT